MYQWDRGCPPHVRFFRGTSVLACSVCSCVHFWVLPLLISSEKKVALIRNAWIVSADVLFLLCLHCALHVG